MPARRLSTRRVEKPWGCRDLGSSFEAVRDDCAPIGEIWFDADTDNLPLMVKYIFTSERLSVQVHPDDAAAQAAGYPRGKDEAWLILSAGSNARVALGPLEVTSLEAIEAAAIDGTIVDMLDWRHVHAGEAIYSAAGTIHAIGADIALIEVQQNVDLTYRLYDYGRARELHLAEATAVADPRPSAPAAAPVQLAEGRELLCEGGKFVMERWRWSGADALALPDGLPGWFVPIAGGGRIDGVRFAQGECWLVESAAALDIDDGAEVLFAYATPERLPLFRSAAR